MRPEKDIRVELRVNSVTLVADDELEFTVQLTRANLSLGLEGLEAARFGEPAKPNDISIEHKTTNECTRQAEGSVAGELSLTSQPATSLSAKGSASAASKVTESVTAHQTDNLLRVKARENFVWEITEPAATGRSH